MLCYCHRYCHVPKDDLNSCLAGVRCGGRLEWRMLPASHTPDREEHAKWSGAPVEVLFTARLSAAVTPNCPHGCGALSTVRDRAGCRLRSGDPGICTGGVKVGEPSTTCRAWAITFA